MRTVEEVRGTTPLLRSTEHDVVGSEERLQAREFYGIPKGFNRATWSYFSSVAFYIRIIDGDEVLCCLLLLFQPNTVDFRSRLSLSHVTAPLMKSELHSYESQSPKDSDLWRSYLMIP